MELDFNFSILRVKQQDTVTVQSVASAVHGDLVAEAIVKLAGVFGGSGFAVLACFERFPKSARGGRKGGKGVGDRPIVEYC